MKDLLYKMIMESKALGYAGLKVPENVSKVLDNFTDSRIPQHEIIERENDHHVTLKYGIHTNKASLVQKAVSEYDKNEIWAMTGQINIFDNDEHDVIVVKVISPDIEKLNHLLCSNLDCTDTFKEYKPHITLAYVEKGTGEKFSGHRGLWGMKFVANLIEFSDASKKTTRISLK